MDEVSAPYSIVIGANDPFLRGRLQEVVANHPSFDALAAVTNAVQAVDVAKHCEAHALILVDESPGTRGRDVLAGLAADLPLARVIITSTGDLFELAQRPNVSAAVANGDLDGVWYGLDALSVWLDDPTEFGINRRMAADRRKAQDWSKTFAQRRVGTRRPTEPANP